MTRVLAIDLDAPTLEIVRDVAARESVDVDVRDDDKALSWLDGSDDVDAVLVGIDREVIRLIRRCQTRLPRVPVVVLGTQGVCDQVNEALRFNPLGGRNIVCVTTDSREHVRQQVSAALARRRRRAASARTFSALNRQLARSEPPPPHAASLLGRLLEIAPVGVLIVDERGTIRDLNRRAVELIEPLRAGASVWEVFPNAHDALGALFEQLAQEPATQPHAAFQREAQSGAIDVELTATALTPEAGGPGYLLIFEDVTERRRLVRELQSASRAKDEFIAMLGHELRNPLAPIRTVVELLRVKHGALVQRECTVIERHVEHMVNLVDDLLDVSRIAQGKLQLRHEHVDMPAVVRDAIEMATPLIEQRAHTLHVDLPASAAVVMGDRRRLAQVVSNLLTNAAKYTDTGGSIFVSVAATREHVVVRVRDTGRGIRAELLPHIFELFVQERQGIDRSGGGLGLGLAIVRSLVQLHGGTITVESHLGAGSEFAVELPRAAAAAADEVVRHASPPPAVAPSGVRVLVVDDNEDGAELMADVLRDRYEVQIAHDGVAALRVAETFRPDVVLLDLGLPVMDGWEVARRLRERPDLAAVRIIAVSGYAQEHDRARSTEAGFYGHLVKPVSIVTLLEVIERAMKP